MEDFGQPFQQFMIWTDFGDDETPYAWQRMIVLRELQKGRRDGLTHDAYVYGEDPKKRRRGVGLSMASHEAGSWVGIREVGVGVAASAVPPAAAQPRPVARAKKVPPAAAPSSAAESSSAASPPSKWVVMPSPQHGQKPVDLDCPPTPLDASEGLPSFAVPRSRSSKRAAPAPAAREAGRSSSRARTQLKPFAPNDNNDGLAAYVAKGGGGT